MAQRFYSIDDLAQLPAPQWAIEGLFEVNGLVMVAGPPGVCKSFMVLDWALCMASGRKWQGRPTVPARVLYVLGEGKASLLKRIQAWTTYNQVDDVERGNIVSRFRVSFEVPQIALKSSVDNVLAQLAAEGFAPEVIVIDTFARSFVGLNENDAKDTGMWVESADRLRQLGYTVIFLHHTNKNTEFGLKYRGSSAIMGAMDSAFTMNNDYKSPGHVVFECVKQKDHDEGQPLYFQRLKVYPNPAEEGSLVLTPSVRVDERFTPEGQAKEDNIRATMFEVLEDHSLPTDQAKAEAMAERLELSVGACKARISRFRSKHG